MRDFPELISAQHQKAYLELSHISLSITEKIPRAVLTDEEVTEIINTVNQY